MTDRISRKDLAEEWGVTTQRVDKLVSEGKLIVGDDKLLSRAQADAVRRSLDPSLVEKEVIAKAVGGQTASVQDPSHPLVKARTMDAVFRAKSRELQFQKASGAVVAMAAIKTEAFEIGRALQQPLLAFPARLSAELATLAALPADQVEPAMRKVLQREVKVLISNLIVALDQVQSMKTT